MTVRAIRQNYRLPRIRAPMVPADWPSALIPEWGCPVYRGLPDGPKWSHSRAVSRSLERLALHLARLLG